MFSAHDLARELRDRLPTAGNVKIHKLSYYCQGWQLAWAGEPMFPEAIEAWANGPVVADLWRSEKRQHPTPPPQGPTGSQFAVIEYVVERYGQYSGRELIHMTHEEAPWRDATSQTDDSSNWLNPGITHEALLAWFSHDEKLVAHRAGVAELRQHRHIYGFAEPAMPEYLLEATLRVLQEPG